MSLWGLDEGSSCLPGTAFLGVGKIPLCGWYSWLSNGMLPVFKIVYIMLSLSHNFKALVKSEKKNKLKYILLR